MGIDNVETARMAARESVRAFEDPKCAAELANIRGECERNAFLFGWV